VMTVNLAQKFTTIWAENEGTSQPIDTYVTYHFFMRQNNN